MVLCFWMHTWDDHGLKKNSLEGEEDSKQLVFIREWIDQDSEIAGRIKGKGRKNEKWLQFWEFFFVGRNQQLCYKVEIIKWKIKRMY